MSERMNKDRAIEILKAIKEEDDIKYCNYKERYYKALDIAIESLDNEWVDVRDRLPKEREYVLICTNYGRKIYVACRSYGTIDVDFDASKYIWWSGSTHKPENVIAWKPLPKPYERKE